LAEQLGKSFNMYKIAEILDMNMKDLPVESKGAE
jgi:hypothetical protein